MSIDYYNDNAIQWKVCPDKEVYRFMKMTFQPKKKSHARVHGFRKRMLTSNGRKVLSARRAKGRHKISA